MFSNPTSKRDGKEMENNVKLTFKERDFIEFRSQLLKRDGLERQSYCLTGVAERERNLEILVHKMIHPSDEDYRVQRRFLVDTKPEFLLRVFSEFERSELKGFLHAHSHPFTARAAFSGGDDRHLVGEIKSVRDYVSLSSKPSDFYFIRLVYGESERGFSGEVYTPGLDRCGNIEEIKVVGRSGVRKYNRVSSSEESNGGMLPQDLERWDRHIRWLGEEGQRKISGTHLVVCGVGGIGSVVVANAKGLGFKEITLIDPDKVEMSNLNRLMGAERDDVGKFKVGIMEREIRKVDPGVVVHVLPCKVEEDEAHRAIIDGDVIISGLDDLSSRFEVQILSARYLKPLLDIGSGISLKADRKTVADMGGQVVLYYPGGPCLACQGIPIFEAVTGLSNEIRRTVGYVRGTDVTPPSVVTTNSVIGGMAMNTLVKYLVGFPINSTHTKYDLMGETIHHFNFGKKAECPICGSQGLEGRGDEFAEILPCPQENEASDLMETGLIGEQEGE